MCYCHLLTQLQRCGRARSERRSGPPTSEVDGTNCTARERETTGRVNMKVNSSTKPDYCVFTHHKTAHAPVSALWAKEVLIFLHFQAFLRAGSGIGRNLTIVFSSLKEHTDPPVTRSVDPESITTLRHRTSRPEFTSNPY